MDDKNIAIEQVISDLEAHIKASKGLVTTSSAVIATGYSLDNVNTALNRILEIYDAKVTMDSSTGALQFNFEFPLSKHGKKNFKEIFSLISQKLWKVFTYVYKASLGIILIAYTIIFAIVVLVGIKGILRSDDDDDDSGMMGFNLVSIVLRAIIEYAFWNSDRIIENQYNRSPKTNFISSVFSFVLGKDRKIETEIEKSKRIASYIASRPEGRVTASDFVFLTGKNFAEAEIEFAHYVGKLSGEFCISNEGYISAIFPRLTESPTHERNHSITFADIYEEEITLTGNKTSRNIAIAAMNTFNLVISGSIISILSNHSDIPFSMIFGLGIFPFIFSIFFFLIPLARIPFVANQRAKYKERKLRKRVYYYVNSNKGKTIEYHSLLDYSKSNDFKGAHLEAAVNKIIAGIGGEVIIGELGTPLVRFPRIEAEMNK